MMENVALISTLAVFYSRPGFTRNLTGILSPRISDDVVANMFKGNLHHPTTKTAKMQEPLLDFKAQILLLMVVKSFLKGDYKRRQKRICSGNIFCRS